MFSCCVAGPRGECAPKLIADPLAFLTKCREEYGDAVTLVLGGERVILIGDPDLAREVVDQARLFVKVRPFGPGSFSAEIKLKFLLFIHGLVFLYTSTACLSILRLPERDRVMRGRVKDTSQTS